MLEDLKILLNVTDKDALLEILIRKAENYVTSYCNLDATPETLKDTVVDIAIIKYNRIGTEGATSESFSGVSTTYESDIPNAIKKVLNRHRQVFK